jgi:two-component system sensor histidine kinase DctS
MTIMQERNDQLPGSGAQEHGLREQLAASTQWALLRELAAGLANELNQPLAAITAYAEGAASLLRRNPPRAAEAVDVLESIAREALRAGGTIQHVRDVIGAVPFCRARVDCDALIRSLQPVLETLGEQHGVALRLDLFPGPASVTGDAIWLQTLVLLLFRNALAATADLPAGHAQVTISVHGDSQWVEVGIADNGPRVSGGVPRTLLARIEPAGGGLGLAACESIALQHGATLRHRDLPAGGARFYVRFPAVPAG